MANPFIPNRHQISGTGILPVQSQAKACGYINMHLHATWY